MANWFVDSTASGTAAGTSWANAFLTVGAAATAAAAGDSVFVATSHSETTSSALTWTFAGTVGSPVKVLCTDKANATPASSDLVPSTGSTTPTTSGVATVSTTGTSGLTIGGCVVFRGIALSLGSSSNSASLSFATSLAISVSFELCWLTLNNTSTTSRLNVLSGPLDFLNCGFTFGNTSQGFSVAAASGVLRIRGSGSAIAQSGSVPAVLLLMSTLGRGGLAILDGLDLSAFGSGKTLVSTNSSDSYVVQVLNCKLSSSVTVNAGGQGAPLALVVDLVNSDSGATSYRNERYAFSGVLTTDTTNVRTGGANDSVQGAAWKVVTTGNSSMTWPFECFEVVQWWGSGLGSSHTASIAISNNTGNLTGADIWVEAEYLGSSASPLGSVAKNTSYSPTDVLGSGTAWPADTTSTWGGSPTYKQTLSVSFTPQMAGFVRFKIKVAKTSVTVWIDPLAVIV